MTPTKTIEQVRDELADEFAVENRGYDFFENDKPFAINFANCFKAGFDAALKHLAEQEMGEFDEAAVIQESNKFWEVVKGCRGETLAKHIARWQHAQTAALVNALKNDRYFYQKSRDEYKKLFDESQIKIAELEKRLKNG